MSLQVERTLGNNGKPKVKPQYYLPTFDTIIDTRCFYDVEADLQPDPNAYCDFPSCTRRDTDSLVRIASFHCFHQACLSSHDCCPICLKKKVQKLANTFNNGLLASNETDTIENNADVRNEEYISTPASMSVTEAQSFHSSTEWAVKIDSTLNSYAPIPLPSQPYHSTPITLQFQLPQMYLPLTALLVFSHQLLYHHITMSMSLTGPFHTLSLSQQFLEQLEAMPLRLLPFCLAKCFFHPMLTFL